MLKYKEDEFMQQLKQDYPIDVKHAKRLLKFMVVMSIGAASTGLSDISQNWKLRADWFYRDLRTMGYGRNESKMIVSSACDYIKL